MKHLFKTKIYNLATKIWDLGIMCWLMDIIRDWSFNEDQWLD